MIDERHREAAADDAAGAHETQARADDAPPGDGGAQSGDAAQGAAQGAPAPRRLPPLEPLALQPEFAPRSDVRYELGELLNFHDRPFVEAAYAAALDRAPAPAEIEAGLAELRAGRLTKQEFVGRLVRSEEGARVGAGGRVPIPTAPAWKRHVQSLPVVGYLWRLAAALARLPLLVQHQQQFEAFALGQQQVLADFINSQQSRIDYLLDAQQRHVAEFVNERQQLITDFVNEREQRVVELVNARERRLSELFDERQRLLVDFVYTEKQRVVDFVNAREQYLTDFVNGRQKLVVDLLYAEKEQVVEFVNARNQEIVEFVNARHRHVTEFVESERRALQDYVNGELRPAIMDASEAASMLSDAVAEVAARQEFLLDERTAIVEAQKAALALLEERLRETIEEQRREIDRIAREPHAPAADARPAGGDPA